MDSSIEQKAFRNTESLFDEDDNWTKNGLETNWDDEHHLLDVPEFNKILKGCLDSDGDSVNDADDQCPLVSGLITNFGCPESVKDIIKAEKVDLEAADKNTLEEAFKNLEFASGQSQMKEESKLNLDKIIEILNRNPSFRLLIVGHTDNTGDAKANTQLSLERANAVKNYMVSKGLNTDRFITKGYGPDRPIADNKIDTGKQKNRRVEMTIVK